MNCVLFAKMDKVFSKENKTLKKILEKSGNFVSPEKWEPCVCGGGGGGCQSGKVGTMSGGAGDCAWQGAYMAGGSCVGGVHGRGRAWQGGACMVEGCAWWGACVAEGACTPR